MSFFIQIFNFGKVPTLQQKWLVVPEQNVVEKQTLFIYSFFQYVSGHSYGYVFIYIFNVRGGELIWPQGWVDMHVIA